MIDYFQGHTSTLNVQFNRRILIKVAHKHQWDMDKKWLDFGEVDLIFKDTPALWMSNFYQIQIVCTLSLEQNDVFWPNFMYCIIGIVKRFD